jgi:hypothetical protein
LVSLQWIVLSNHFFCGSFRSTLVSSTSKYRVDPGGMAPPPAPRSPYPIPAGDDDATDFTELHSYRGGVKSQPLMTLPTPTITTQCCCPPVSPRRRRTHPSITCTWFSPAVPVPVSLRRRLGVPCIATPGVRRKTWKGPITTMKRHRASASSHEPTTTVPTVTRTIAPLVGLTMACRRFRTGFSRGDNEDTKVGWR